MARDRSFDPFGTFLATEEKMTLVAARTPLMRLRALVDDGTLEQREANTLRDTSTAKLTDAVGPRIENCIAVAGVPMGIATGFVINGTPRHVVMATERRAVVQTASYAAGLTVGGFRVGIERMPRSARCDALIDIPYDPIAALPVNTTLKEVMAAFNTMTRLPGRITDLHANLVHTGLTVSPPGMGATRIELHVASDEPLAPRSLKELMRAVLARLPAAYTNALVTITCERTDVRVATASATWSAGSIAPVPPTKLRLVAAWTNADPDRRKACLKRIMDGVSAVALAAGRDTRIIETLARTATASAGKKPKPLLSCELGTNDTVTISFTLPLPALLPAYGRDHPYARIARRIMAAEQPSDVDDVMAAVGLASGFADLLRIARG
jgi:hydroxymethylglutaryl-CoA reductase